MSSESRPPISPYELGTTANYMLDRADRYGLHITHVKLQKLVYFAYGWATVFLPDPLFNNTIEAWPRGPVVRDLWHEFKAFGKKPIREGRAFMCDPYTDELRWPAPPRDEVTREVLDATWRIYGRLPADVLVDITHAKGSPWCQTPLWNPIPHDAIKEHFTKQYYAVQGKPNSESLEMLIGGTSVTGDC